MQAVAIGRVVRVAWAVWVLAVVRAQRVVALITETTTVQQVAAFTDCTGITAAQVNTLLDPYACRGFKRRCLAQFNLTELSGVCKDHLSRLEVSHLPPHKFRQLVSSEDPLHMACFNGVWEYYFPLSFAGLPPPAYIRYCIRDRYWAVSYSYIINAMGLRVTPLLRQVFTRENTPLLDVMFLRVMGPGAVSLLDPPVFAWMTGEQFGQLDCPIWEAQVRQLPPGHFEHWPHAARLPTLDVRVLNTVSPAQAARWGPDPALLPPAAQVLARRTFYLSHPCTYLRPMMVRFHRPVVIAAVEARCGPLWRQPDAPPVQIRGHLTG